MSDSLSPLRQVYDLGEPPPGRSGGAAAAEGEMLRQMRRLLDAAPRSRPEAATLRAIEAHAEAAAPFAAVRGLAADTAEAELLRQSAAALDTLPAATPSDDALASVLAHAADASAPLAPIRATYGLTQTAGDPVETAILTQTRAALDAAWTAQRPTAEAVDAVLARAASWSAETVGTTTAPSVAGAYGLAAPLDTPEAAVVAGSADALDRLPVHRPSGEALAAVLAAAATASQTARASAPPVTTRPSVARTPRSAATAAAVPAALWARRPAVWGGALAAVVAVVVAIGLYDGATPMTESAVQQEVAFAAPVAEAPEAEAPAPPPPAAPAPAPSAGAQALAAGGPLAGTASAPTLAPPVAALAVVPQRRAAPTPAPVRAAPLAAAEPLVQTASADRAAPPAALTSPAPPAPTDDLTFEALAESAPAGDDAWDTADDVRLLALRLQQLRRENAGLDWDAPAEAFGVPAASELSSSRGLQSVGIGAAAAPARARALVDTTLDR